MERKVSFQVEEAIEVPEWTKNYPEHKFSVFKTCFLSTRPNSHHLDIDDATLRKYASTILGGFLVAKIQNGDSMSHEEDEQVYGVFPRDQKIEFVEEDGFTKAYAYAVVSKIYGKDFNAIFEGNNLRNSSVEMTVVTEDDADEGKVISFDLMGLCCLGHRINGSCPDADITMIRFSEEEANAYFSESSILSDLEKFVEDRKKSMAEKYVSHPINTSKEAIYEGEWDGNKAKQDLVKEKNYKTLAPKVCLRLEPGWEDREVTKLGYPVMGLYDGEWRYSAKALAFAQGYAEKENETEVLKKIKAIKKKLGLDDSNGKEETKMAEQETEKVKMKAVEAEKETPVENTVSEPEKADMAGPETKCEERPCDDDEHDVEEHEDFEAKCAQLTKDIEERDNIIMEKDAKIGEYEKELADLREYKRCVEASQLACKVEEVLSSVEKFANDEQMSTFREEGKKCTLETIADFENKVKAICFENVKKKKSKEDDMIKMSINLPKTETESGDIWTRLENKYNK